MPLTIKQAPFTKKWHVTHSFFGWIGDIVKEGGEYRYQSINIGEYTLRRSDLMKIANFIDKANRTA